MLLCSLRAVEPDGLGVGNDDVKENPRSGLRNRDETTAESTAVGERAAWVIERRLHHRVVGRTEVELHNGARRLSDVVRRVCQAAEADIHMCDAVTSYRKSVRGRRARRCTRRFRLEGV